MSSLSPKFEKSNEFDSQSRLFFLPSGDDVKAKIQKKEDLKGAHTHADS